TSGGISITGGAGTGGTAGVVHWISSIGCDGTGGGCSIAGGGGLIDGGRKVSVSNGIRMAGGSALVTNRERTSSVSESDAAEVCARSIAGNALLARLLAHAATMSLTAW